MDQTKNPENVSSRPLEYIDNHSNIQPGMIVIKVREGVGKLELQTGTVSFKIPTLDQLAVQYEVNLLEQRFKFDPRKLKEGMPDLSRIYRIGFQEDQPVFEVVEAFRADPNIEYAEPVFLGTFLEEPDDYLYPQCQHLPQIMAPEAWDLHHGEDGEEEVVVAIVDTGTDWLHPDLVENTWQNLGEDADGDGVTLEFNGSEWVRDPDDLNGIDDDGNGYVDDVIGWDFHEDTWYDDGSNPDPLWDQGPWYHGTHCSGIAAGRTDNEIGIASVSWNVKYMPVQTDNGNNTVLYGFDGIIYAAENGADIISNSWGFYSPSESGAEAVEYAQQLGSLVVASAGNDNTNTVRFPAGYVGVVGVASVNVDDTKTVYSTFGPGVDISAPGGGWEGGILSTMPDNTYTVLSGTSMAGPMVAGALGLLKSYHPDWTNEQLITQVLGTTDDIDPDNPAYEHQMGTGRLNAYNMLADENVTMVQEFKIGMTNAVPVDESGDKINEAGEEVTLNFEFWNYVPFVSEDEVTITLQCTDPDIEILDGTATVNIPPEGPFSIEDQFQVKVSEDAGSHIALLSLHFESEIPVVFGQDMEYQLLVAPSGIFVFEGENKGRDFSGTFIRNFLEKLGFDVTYSNTYPYSLLGFETVFTSHGNMGENWSHGYPIQEEHALLFQEFLENGGSLYVEMDRMFTRAYFQGFSNYAELKALFSISSHYSPTNQEIPVDSLIGMEDTPFDGITFTESNQIDSWHIEKPMALNEAKTPFTEYDYGKVSVMNDGSSSYGQKTFYFTYALAELVDNSPANSRYNVLMKILDFFGHDIPEGFVMTNFMADQTIGPPPLEVQFTDISLSDEGFEINSWAWDFDSDGTIDSYEQHPVKIFSDGGNYDVTLIVSNGTDTDTLMIEEFIRVNHGCLVYEGVQGGSCSSGTFISDHLMDIGYPCTYMNDFPETFLGYSSVFLSFGNYGIDYTEFNSTMASTVEEYLQSGGFLYLEGSDALGWDQASNAGLLQLFGLDGSSDGTTNVIDALTGQENSLATGLEFTSSSQPSNVYIDIYVPLEDAAAAFDESDYGIVAVQNTGEHEQRTFCFSYALSRLNDGEYPSTREELLYRICSFFDIYTGTGDLDISGAETVHLFPNPCGDKITVRFTWEERTDVLIRLYAQDGRLVKLIPAGDLQAGPNSRLIDLSGLPPGIYFCMLQSIDRMTVEKIIKKE